MKTENDKFTFSCEFEETQFSSSNANVQVTSPNGGINEEKMLKIIRFSKSEIQDIYEMISPRLSSCGNLSKMTKILVFLLVVKENILNFSWYFLCDNVADLCTFVDNVWSFRCRRV